MKRLRVYIAGPISKGDLAHNIDQGTEAFIALAKAGLAPMCPQWSCYAKPTFQDASGVLCRATREGGTSMTHADWIGVDLAWVDVCHALLRLPGESKGADMECWHAVEKRIPYFGTVKEVIEWASAQGE